jgi:hypothetical protein
MVLDLDEQRQALERWDLLLHRGGPWGVGGPWGIRSSWGGQELVAEQDFDEMP